MLWVIRYLLPELRFCSSVKLDGITSQLFVVTLSVLGYNLYDSSTKGKGEGLGSCTRWLTAWDWFMAHWILLVMPYKIKRKKTEAEFSLTVLKSIPWPINWWLLDFSCFFLSFSESSLSVEQHSVREKVFFSLRCQSEASRLLEMANSDPAVLLIGLITNCVDLTQLLSQGLKQLGEILNTNVLAPGLWTESDTAGLRGDVTRANLLLSLAWSYLGSNEVRNLTNNSAE